MTDAVAGAVLPQPPHADAGLIQRLVGLRVACGLMVYWHRPDSRQRRPRQRQGIDIFYELKQLRLF